jgi:hypothetical protein
LLKYLLISIVCGFGLILGGLSAAILFPELLHRSWSDTDHQERIDITESSIGVSCLDLFDEAKDFACSEGLEIVRTIKPGNLRGELLDQNQSRFIARIHRPLLECAVIRDNALELGYIWPDFHKVDWFLTSLKLTSDEVAGSGLAFTDLDVELLGIRYEDTMRDVCDK